MKAKRFVAIGLLTAAAVALVGCAIALSKKNKQYKPKTMQTNAEYYIDMISDTDNYTDITIKGTLENNNLPTLEEGETFWLLQGNYTLYIYKFNPNPRIALYLKPTTINRLTFDSVDTIQQEEDVYFSQNMPNETGFNFGAYDLQQKEIKDITIKQTKVDYYPQTHCYINMSIQVKYTDDTITNANFTDNQIPNNYITDDVFELDFEDTRTYTKEKIQISNTLSTIKNYAEEKYTEGYTLGNEEGYEEGYDYGYDTGYTTGYQTKGDLADGNFMDIKNMMLNVLTMPFTFINQAFDVTLWEGTEYQFNIGNFIKGIIAISTILFIIRLFTSGFSIIGNYTNDARARKDTSNLRRSQTELNKAKTKATNENKPKVTHQYIHKD